MREQILLPYYREPAYGLQVDVLVQLAATHSEPVLIALSVFEDFALTAAGMVQWSPAGTRDSLP